VSDDLSDFEVVPFDPGSMPMSSLGMTKAVWYRRPWVLITIALVLVAAISVIIDLPKPLTKAQDAASQDASIKEINRDLADCSFAAKESFSLYNSHVEGRLSASDLTQVPTLLVGDQTACSFASQPVYDLTNNLQIDDTTAGKHIDRMLSVVEKWITDNSLAAIEDIQYLFRHPGDAARLNNLAAQEVGLAHDRSKALGDEREAEAILSMKLTPLKMPTLPTLKDV
jgi:hypothetical protein